MRHNPALKRLGFGPSDRVVVFHADDVGMCQATIPAFAELTERGLVSSGSLMVPCPWFPAAAAWCRSQPGADAGVHLTLTSEWDGYRWGPIAAHDPASGLLDEEGFFHRCQDAWKGVDLAAVRREMRAQVERAQAAGVDVTHIDCHMFAILKPGLADPYVELGFELRIPSLILRQKPWVRILSEAAIARWEERGLPIFDDLCEIPWNQPPEDQLALAKRILSDLPPGLFYWILHPARDTPELRAIGRDWRQRTADLETFLNPELRRHAEKCGVQAIGWRLLRELMPGRS